jgi:hypothetical protein
MALDAPGLPSGELVISQHGEHAGSGPALLVGPLGDGPPVRLDARQAQGGEHGRQLVDVDRARSWPRLQQGIMTGQRGQRDGHVGRSRAVAAGEAAA